MALLFSGGANYVQAANESSFDFEHNQAFTQTFWIKPTNSPAAHKHLMRKFDGVALRGLAMDRSGAINVGQQNVVFYLVSTLVTNAIYAYSNTSLADSVWTHVCVTYDGSDSAAGVKVYFNGVSSSMTTPWDTLTATTLNNVTYDVNSDESGNPTEGSFSDWRVYSRALSAAEAQTLYSCLGMDGITHGLVSRWNMNDGRAGVTASGSGAIKDAKAANNGTPIASPVFSDGLTTTRRRAA